MSNILNKINHLRTHGYDLDFGDTFTESFELWKKVVFYGIVAFLIIGVFMVLIYGVLLTSTFGSVNEMIEQFQNDPIAFQLAMSNPKYLGIGALIQVAVGALFSPMIAGIFKLIRQADTGAEIKLSSLFDYYKQPYFGRLFLFGVLSAIVTALVGFIIGYFVPQLGIINMVFSIIWYSFLVFAVPLIIFGNMGAVQAFTSSFSLASIKYFIIFALLIVTYIIFIFGSLITCGLGALFLATLLFTMQYAIYKHSVGFENELDAIGKE